jgi:uncharacterized protein (DUF1800 family)
MELKHVYHLYRRAGFGILPKDAAALSRLSREEVVNGLFEASEDYEPLHIDMAPFDELFEEYPEPTFAQFRRVVLNNTAFLIPLNKAWMERLCDPSRALNERMTLFWANVFVCGDVVPPYIQQYNNTLRRNALGNFKDFTIAISKEPTMIRYLNTEQNKKAHPNENFARELMELFTLGPDQYTEDDIKEAARAFTGYGYHRDGRFLFNDRTHDFGEKEFFGFKGNMDGDTIIKIITRKRECAQFICTKIYRYFVNEIPNEARINELVAVFYPAYEISEVMHYLFTSEWFYASENIGTKIKSPMDLLSSMYRLVPFQFTDDKQHIVLQRLLGQQLSKPPNVAGWEGGRAWIDINTMLIRLKLSSVLLGEGFVPYSERRMRGGRWIYGNDLKLETYWEHFDENYGSLSEKELKETVLACPVTSGTEQVLVKAGATSAKELCLQLMSLPDFQLT